MLFGRGPRPRAVGHRADGGRARAEHTDERDRRGGPARAAGEPAGEPAGKGDAAGQDAAGQDPSGPDASGRAGGGRRKRAGPLDAGSAPAITHATTPASTLTPAPALRRNGIAEHLGGDGRLGAVRRRPQRRHQLVRGGPVAGFLGETAAQDGHQILGHPGQVRLVVHHLIGDDVMRLGVEGPPAGRGVHEHRAHANTSAAPPVIDWSPNCSGAMNRGVPMAARRWRSGPGPHSIQGPRDPEVDHARAVLREQHVGGLRSRCASPAPCMPRAPRPSGGEPRKPMVERAVRYIVAQRRPRRRRRWPATAGRRRPGRRRRRVR